MGSASLPELGFIPKTPSPGQRRRSASNAVLAVSLTECFFTTHTPCHQSCCGNRIAPSILLWQQDCFTQSCRGNRIAPSILLWQQDCFTQSCCGNRIAPSILLWQQDCFTHSCAGNRIAPVHYEQLGLGTVLARAQACDGVGPAVELPGLGHVVDADDEGQAAREECVSQLRVKDQVTLNWALLPEGAYTGARLAAWISSNFATATYGETTNSLSVAYDGNRLILNDLELRQQFPDAADYPSAPAASPTKPFSIDHMLGSSFVSGGQQVFEFLKMMAHNEVYLRCAQLANASRVLGNLGDDILSKITLKSGVGKTTGTSWHSGARLP